MEEEVKILKKLLNHKIFLDEFPGITYVAVDKFGESIDVVFFYRKGVSYAESKSFRQMAGQSVRDLAKMAGVHS
ncbi:MAG: hypothetical protein ORN50_03250, partial [Crocinitomicaceae bacterium]|nr:hypothetical protein [Crocinitomicaceae bacterium]